MDYVLQSATPRFALALVNLDNRRVPVSVDALGQMA